MGTLSLPCEGRLKDSAKASTVDVLGLNTISGCLVPRPQYFASVIRFGSRGAGRSSGIRHSNQLIANAWEKAVQELGKDT